ncbi:MAG TPA: hypothetical protein H9736_00245 [Candidatus Anaerotruncus excrementipullorum]|uniref:Integral membrane protein n=1 Tax=Candidatus Anaerotruncus excrementipullorum TaxID=2838465 RepID=A0A9D1WRF8_9FIRM|nr:hypothetical protein [Candidatus Anaerotruncus excrementipullorum]
MNNYGYGRRLSRVLLGQLINGLGVFLTLQANIGLAPWSAFNVGLTNLTPLSYGDASIVVGAVVVIFDLIMRERIGLGTLLDILLCGKIVDFCKYINLVPMMDSLFSGIVCLLLGELGIALGTYFYVSGGLCCGPRDGLMVGLVKRLRRISVGVIRGVLEGTVLVLGWLMGAKVGIGTVIAVFGISFILDGTFRVFHFDVTQVQHEDLRQTWQNLRRRVQTSEI